MAISLDGFIGRADETDPGLYDWYFDPPAPSSRSIDELVETTGAIVLGRGAFGTGEDAGGWDDTPYDVKHFVVTHRPPPPAPTGRSSSSSSRKGCSGRSSWRGEAAGDAVRDHRRRRRRRPAVPGGRAGGRAAAARRAEAAGRRASRCSAESDRLDRLD